MMYYFFTEELDLHFDALFISTEAEFTCTIFYRGARFTF